MKKIVSLIALLFCMMGMACLSTPDHPRIPTISTLNGFYQDKIYGYSIHYPQAWNENQNGTGGARLIIHNTNRTCNIQVFVEELDQPISAADYWTGAIGNFERKLDGFQIITEGAVMLGEQIAYECTFNGIESNQLLTANLVCLTDKQYSYSILAAAHHDIHDLLKDQIDSTIYSFRLGKAFSLADIPRDESLVLLGIPPITLDPALILDSDSVIYIHEIFSGLVTLNQQMKIIPDIAESWDISNEGTVYTFHLREDAKFHNGKPVTASDFKYSIERACDPQIGSQIAGNYLNDIVGVLEKLEGKANEIHGVEVVDQHTLRITIKNPTAYFLSKLLYPTSFVLDENNVNSGEQWWREPNGTGPFEISVWEKDEILVLKSNKDYYGEPAKVEYVVYRMWGGLSMSMYEQGEIDITPVPGTSLDRILDPSDPLNVELYIVPELSLNYVGFNASEPPFDDVKVRQAFCHAIDKDRIIEALFVEGVQKANGILPPAMPGYSDSILGLDYDPQKARDLISESIYGNVSALPSLTYTTSGRGFVSPLTEALIDMWRRNLGVEISIRQIDPESYPYTIKEEKDQLFDIGWLADYPDPHNFLDILFHSESGDNIGEYANVEMDELIETARTEIESDVRYDMYQEIEQKLVEDAACLPLYFSQNYTLVKPYVKGFIGSPLPMPWLKYITVEPHE